MVIVETVIVETVIVDFLFLSAAFVYLLPPLPRRAADNELALFLWFKSIGH